MSANSAHDIAGDKRRYWQVFWWLSALTLFELVAVHFPIAKKLIALILVILACTKAAKGSGTNLPKVSVPPRQAT